MSIPRDVSDVPESADNFREASAGIFCPRPAEVQPIPEAESPTHVPADRTRIPRAKRGPTKQSLRKSEWDRCEKIFISMLAHDAGDTVTRLEFRRRDLPDEKLSSTGTSEPVCSVAMASRRFLIVFGKRKLGDCRQVSFPSQ